MKRIVSGIMLTLLFVGMLTLAFNVQPVKAGPRTWTVDDDGPADFHIIQEAINAASPGDTILVAVGTYNENITVSKSISLIGENTSTTIIEGGGADTVVYITANYVKFIGFTVQNGVYNGIHLHYSQYSNISHNSIKSVFFNGILINNSHQNHLIDNNITSIFYIGIYFENSDQNNLRDNTVTNNMFGIRLSASSSNSFRNNHMINNEQNFGVEGWQLSHFTIDIDTSNTVNGKPVYYLINEHDLIINPSAFPNIGYIGLVSSENITVMDLNLTNNLQGVLFAYTRDSTIEKVTATNNGRGVHLFSSDNNTITCNTLTLNGYGIDVSYSIDTNIRDNIILGGSNGILLWHVSYSAVTQNIISNAGGTGIDLADSDGNKLSENNVTGNTCGIYTSDANGNSIFHNNFIDNIYDQVRNPEAYYSVNIWDDGYPSGGNYWSDYAGVDADGDGIGDTHYVIDADNQDRYPLMHPWSSLPVHNINTGLGYETIQEAINAPETLDGHAIFVDAGTYFENIVVDKTLTLIGGNRDTTIIDGGGVNLFYLTASNVKITGFTIKGFGTPVEWKGGIYIQGSSGNNISGNILKNNVFLSISLINSGGNFIGNNIITSNNGGGILLGWGSSGNTLVGNIISNLSMQGGFTNGILILNSVGNTLVNNTILNVRGIGVEITQSGGSVLRGNSMCGSIYNFRVEGNYPDYINDIDDSNTVDGKPIYYWVNQTNRDVPKNAGYVALIGSTNITVRDLDLTRNGEGVIFHHTTSSLIENVTISKTLGGISLRFSSGNIIRRNLLTDNGNYGIELFASGNNIITDNTILNNSEREGILIWYSDGNRIYHNNFINNMQQVYSIESANVWDDGYPSGGNYWSDYVGVDVKSGLNQDLPESDGIGDTPYIIDADNQDRYPLMRPWTLMPTVYTFSIVWEEETFTVSVESNSTVSNFAFNQPNKEISFYVTGPDGTIGFYNVTIPKQLLYGEPWSVLIDGISVTPTIAENETHSILYFTYIHSTHKVQIIGTHVITPPPPPLSASISPLSASILVGQSVTFTSTVSGGYTPYNYQWYLNGATVSGATSNTWTFTPTTVGIYYIHLKVTDAKGSTAQSEPARITVATVPVGGYSIPIQAPTKAEPLLPYIALIATLTAIFTKLRPKTKRKH